MNHRALSRSLTLLGLIALSSVASAQTDRDAAPPPLAGPLASWRARHGESWQIVVDPETGFAKMIFGGRRAADSRPHDDAAFLDLARGALAESAPLHGIDPASLVAECALFLPLGQIGSTDKVTVRLRQSFGGVPVVGGYANVLFDVEGRMLSVQTTGLPSLSRMDTTPSIEGTRAQRRAADAFHADAGVAATRLSEPELVIAQVERLKGRQGVLAWQVDAVAELQDAVPEGFTYSVSYTHLTLPTNREV